MTFEWDLKKERQNIAKHGGIDFDTALKVFSDPNVFIKHDEIYSDLDEDRWIAIGYVEDFLYVVFTVRGEDNYRIISARFAEKREIYEYYGY